MKHMVKSLIIVGVAMLANNARADVLANLEPFVGIDYQQTWMKTNKDYQDYFPKSYPGANVYVGTKFMQNFGVELGADLTSNKKKKWRDSEAVNLAPFLVNTDITGTTKVRRNGFHVDLLGFLPITECAEVFANVGIGFTKVKSTFTVTNATIGNVDVLDLAASIFDGTETTKNKPVLRLGIGGLYMITDMFGVRAKLGWENTSRLRFKGLNSFKNYKDSQMAFLGAFVKF